jgi:hypothetical protein
MISLGAQGHHNHSAGDRRALASGRLPPVLALEILLAWRPTEDRCGTARADPADECGKSFVGSAAKLMGQPFMALALDRSTHLIIPYRSM